MFSIGEHEFQTLHTTQRRIYAGRRFPHSTVGNTGSYTPSKGLNQGFKSDDGRYYGQAVFDYLRLSKTDSVGHIVPVVPETANQSACRNSAGDAPSLSSRGEAVRTHTTHRTPAFTQYSPHHMVHVSIHMCARDPGNAHGAALFHHHFEFLAQ